MNCMYLYTPGPGIPKLKARVACCMARECTGRQDGDARGIMTYVDPAGHFSYFLFFICFGKLDS